METLSDGVDVAQVHKLNFCTRVVLDTLTATASSAICNRGCVAASIHNEDFLKF